MGLLVTDLGSTNGTFVGDVWVLAAYLVPGARLRVGETTLEVRASEAEPARSRRAGSFGRMASASPRMMNVLSLSEKLAPTDAPVVLEGETGTGKERLAECIHEASKRAAQPFVVLDCRTTPRELMPAHLFGELRADGVVRAGIFEAAHGGTLFIDEPGDLDVEVQGKLRAPRQGDRRAPRGHDTDPGRRLRDRRDEPRPGQARRAGEVPRGLCAPALRGLASRSRRAAATA